MKLFAFLLVSVGLSGMSVGFTCRSKDLDRIERHIERLSDNGGSVQGQATFNAVWAIAKALTKGRCLEIAQICDARRSRQSYYAYIGRSWDWEFTGPLNGFSMFGSRKTQRAGTRYVVELRDEEQAAAMLQCYRDVDSRIKELTPEEEQRLRDAIRGSKF